MNDLNDFWLAVDFKDVGFVSSVALGMLVAIYKLAKSRNSRMVLMNVDGEALRQVIRVTRLDTIFEMVNGEEEALAACKK